MPRYLYSYIFLLGFMGFTPERPGSDMGMVVWIDAPDEDQARAWGKRVLEEYIRQRYRFAEETPDPARFVGELITEPERLELERRHGYDESRVCQIGEVPNWIEPWKNDNAEGPPRWIEEVG